MDKDIILGIAITVLGLAFLTYLLFWSRNMIRRIEKKGLKTARDILKDLHSGR